MSCQKLLDRARDLVQEGGYEFKKGKSRSKKLIQDTECMNKYVSYVQVAPPRGYAMFINCHLSWNL